MTENLEKITSGLPYEGKTCPVCTNKVVAEEEVIVCPRCKTVHHVECWKKKGGCGKAGCPQVAAAVRGEKPEGDGPPPPISRKVILAAFGLVLAIVLGTIFWPKPPDPAQGRERIIYLGDADYELTTNLEKIAERFNNSSNEYYLELQLLPPGGTNQKLPILLAANSPPDLVTLSEERLDFFLENEALLALPNGEFYVQHPAQIGKLVILKSTKNPQGAQQILEIFLEEIIKRDLDQLRELEKNQPVFFGL